MSDIASPGCVKINCSIIIEQYYGGHILEACQQQERPCMHLMARVVAGFPSIVRHQSRGHCNEGLAFVPPCLLSAVSQQKTLYTATLKVSVGENRIRAFHACHAFSREEVLSRIGLRVPSQLLGNVDIRQGIALHHPIVLRLVPVAIARNLAEYGDCCPRRRPLAQGRDLNIQECAGR
ncbi:hypothetical protein FHS54_001243 [Sphingobium vermicomposti]|uniref:Uncharacterized protein n=2 Tax=Sphingobium vermicomposti TaxID=529005 RepID=A0A846M299_9SPHN|nr:hypothetical protein [Sphingobium vermicomposti]